MRTIVIRIDRLAGDAYPVTVVADPTALTGELRAADARAAAVDLTGPAVRDADLVTAGRALFDALGVTGLAELLAAAPARVLLDVRAPELRGLPWELLRRPDGYLLFVDPERPAVRGDLPYPGLPPALNSPVRVLVVVGDPYDEGLRAAEEVDGVYTGVCAQPACWHVDVRTAPSIIELRRAFAEIAPHVLHFIGHGTGGGQPALVVNDPVDGPWLLTVDVVLNALKGAPPPRLVVLNACRTAGGDPGPGIGAAIVQGVSDAFLARGTAAVVAMQGNVASAAATVFSQRMYEELSAGAPLDAAVAAARADLCYGRGTHPGDWVLPVLTARADPELVLSVADPVGSDEVLRREPDAFCNVPWLVDRSAERRTMLRWLAPGADTPRGDAPGRNAPGRDPLDEASLLLVAGEEEVGKSWMAQACVLTGRLRGLPVVYVDLLRRPGNLGWVDFMEVLIEAVVATFGDAAKDPAERFSRHLGAVVAQMSSGLPGHASAGALAAALSEPVVPPQPGRPLRPDDYYRAVFDRFGSFAHEVTGDAPLLLVVDHIRRLHQFAEIVTWLVAPVARRELPQVRMAVVDRAEELTRMLPGGVGNPARLSVGRFDRDDIVALAREYCVRIRRRPRYEPASRDEEVWGQFVARMLDWAQDRSGDGGPVDPIELRLSEDLHRRPLGLR